MYAVKEAPQARTETLCYHCGTPCISEAIALNDHVFCCEGCKLVYEILNSNGLCDYYKLQSHPGLSQVKPVRSDKYAYLDNEEISKKLYKFTGGDHTIVTLYIPNVHCSSCMWLLEHLGRVDPNVIESRLNFTAKEITIHFSRSKTSLRKIVELLTTIGYEPYISLDDAGHKKAASFNKQRIYKLGVAGFCFGNIMMMSFPEYLSVKTGIEAEYAHLFRYLNLLLALPVFFYSAGEFFQTAWKGLRQKTLNIDAPIALAIIITFARSVYDIIGNTGGGYLDSMSGIVFFMLVGRVVQERTYKSISFNRDYKSYFPIAVNVVTGQGVVNKMLSELKEKDVVQLHNDEIIPADAMLINGQALIDYSFVTGESEPVTVKKGEVVCAGGRQVGQEITIQVIKPVAGSYLTSLWNHYAFGKDKSEQNDSSSAIHILSRYFTWILLALACCTAVYWYIHNPAKMIPSVTAMLIVACPCALLLAATFTNGNLLRIFSSNGLFLRDATVIEQLGKAGHIVFDKTGTITQGGSNHFVVNGHQLTDEEKNLVYSVVRPSKHPVSKSLAAWLGARPVQPVDSWHEAAGLGLDAQAGGHKIRIGSAAFLQLPAAQAGQNKATVYISIDGQLSAFFAHSEFRDSVPQIVPVLANRYDLSLLSGDHDGQKKILGELFGAGSELLFEQKPMDKLHYIETLQAQGKRVIMIGDGLNDAGALQQSNVGITLADDINNFTPSCDAILDAGKFASFPSVLRLARAGKYIIGAAFTVSIIYNIIGLSFAMQGILRPITAAILMPCSTLSIVIISSGVSSLVAKRLHLSLKTE